MLCVFVSLISYLSHSCQTSIASDWKHLSTLIILFWNYFKSRGERVFFFKTSWPTLIFFIFLFLQVFGLLSSPCQNKSVKVTHGFYFLKNSPPRCLQSPSSVSMHCSNAFTVNWCQTPSLLLSYCSFSSCSAGLFFFFPPTCRGCLNFCDKEEWNYTWWLFPWG